MRFRTSGQFNPVDVTYSNLNTPTWDGVNHGHTDVVVVNTVSNATGQTIRTWDVVTPNYRKRIAKGEIIINAYTNERISLFDSGNGIRTRANNPNPDGSYLINQRDGPQLTWMMNVANRNLTVLELIQPSEVHRLMTLAGTRARANVGKADAELLVMLAELRKTFVTLLNPLNNLNRLLTNLQRLKGQASKSLSLAQYMASEWLKYRYGIMPILYDIQGIIQALERDVGKGIRVARGSESLSLERLDPPAIWAHGDVDTTYLDTYTDLVEIRAGLVYSAELKVRDFLGVNLRSIPSVGWELIPFSFVVDWLFNVQQFIAALSSNGLVDEKGGYLVTTRTKTASRAAIGSTIARNPTASTLERGIGGTRTIIERIKTRITGCPGAGLRSKIDLSLFNWRDKRVIDAFSLVMQKLR
jgi:hypothetical protein